MKKKQNCRARCQLGNKKPLFVIVLLVNLLPSSAFGNGISGSPVVPTISNIEIVKGQAKTEADKDGVYLFGSLLIKTSDFGPATNESVYLIINDTMVKEIKGVVGPKGNYYFKLLPEHVRSFFPKGSKEEEMTISLGTENGKFVSQGKNIWVIMGGRHGLSILEAGVIILIAILVLVLPEKSLVKDPNGKLSLSRLVLFSWTFVIVLVFAYMGIRMGVMPEPNETVLILLAIPGVTLLGAKTVKKDVAKNNDKTSTNLTSFLNSNTDDKTEIHRLQTFLFNYAYMGFFLFAGLGSLYLPEFSENTLLLLGISNGVYVGMKTTEDKQATVDNK